MGCDGGYNLYKLAEINRPDVLRRIQNWFVVNTFENPHKGPHYDWVIIEYGPWVNGKGYESKTAVPIQDWLKKNGFSCVEDISFEFIARQWGINMSILSSAQLPFTEDLVRISYGDNVPDEINDLNEIITNGKNWWGKTGQLAYFDDVDAHYDENHPGPWTFGEETWT